MGRYYTGDIEGKFWFAIQDSDDADHFGDAREDSSCIPYHFNKGEHLESVNEGIATCLEALGENKDKLDSFFDAHASYNDEKIATHLGVAFDDVRNLLEQYARLELGEKIKACLIEQGECRFEAEC